MKKRRKLNHCLNCGVNFTQNENYCPNCGQENTDKHVSLKTLILDFLGDYFTFDSKIVRSSWLLFTRPGFLTKAYNEGQRTKYIPPLRILLISLVFFFFAFSFSDFDKGLRDGLITTDDDISTLLISVDSLQNKTLRKIKSIDHLDSLAKSDLNQKTTELFNELRKQSSLAGDSVALTGNSPLRATFTSPTDTTEMQLDQPENIPDKVEQAFQMLPSVPAEQIIDSLQIENVFYQLLIKQSHRMLHSQGREFSNFILANLSGFLLVIMPVLAGILKLLYIRRSFLYVEHLVFIFHCNAFALLIPGLAILLFNIPEAHAFAFLIAFVYPYLAMKKVYAQPYVKTTLKYMAMNLLQFIVSLVFFILFIGLSFFIF